MDDVCDDNGKCEGEAPPLTPAELSRQKTRTRRRREMTMTMRDARCAMGNGDGETGTTLHLEFIALVYPRGSVELVSATANLR